jgi:hypothetical protein
MKNIKAEPVESHTMACECCGHANVLEVPVSADVKTLIRCSECCHPQSVWQTGFVDFAGSDACSGEFLCDPSDTHPNE